MEIEKSEKEVLNSDCSDNELATYCCDIDSLDEIQGNSPRSDTDKYQPRISTKRSDSVSDNSDDMETMINSLGKFGIREIVASPRNQKTNNGFIKPVAIYPKSKEINENNPVKQIIKGSRTDNRKRESSDYYKNEYFNDYDNNDSLKKIKDEDFYKKNNKKLPINKNYKFKIIENKKEDKVNCGITVSTNLY